MLLGIVQQPSPASKVGDSTALTPDSCRRSKRKPSHGCLPGTLQCVSMDPSNSNESISAKLDAKNLKLHFKGVIIISSILMLLPGFCTHPSQAFISIFFWQGKPHLSPSQHQPRLRAKCIQTSVLFAMLVAWGGKCFGNTWEEELVAQARLGEHAGLLLPVSLLHQVSFS